MALDDADTIDLILGPTRHAKAALVILDGRSHDDPAKRFDLLARKLRAYVAYLQGPQFVGPRAGMKPSDALVCVVCHDPPTEAMKQIQFVRPHADPDPDHRVRVVFAEYRPGQKLPEYFTPEQAPEHPN